MKAILNVVKEMNRKVEEAESKLRYLRGLRDAITPQLDELPKSPNVSKKIEWLAAAIVDIEKEIGELKAILICCRIEFCEWLYKKISDGDVRDVLFYRYGLLKKFDEIAREMNYSEPVIFRLHRIGLKKLGVQASLSDDYEFDSIAIE